MNLVIDVGNTSVKVGVFQNEEMIHKESFLMEVYDDSVKRIKNQFPQISDAIISSVSQVSETDKLLTHQLFDTLELSQSLKLPFENLYATPETLGVDRMALVAAAVKEYPSKNVLVIDAGTCITYDFKNNKENYLGGAIAPGLRLRYQSLHKYTAKLPFLETQAPVCHIGDSTSESIHVGVVKGMQYEIEGAIQEYCNMYGDLTVILTGGDAHFLSKRLKNSIFATSNFLMRGLNYILVFNKNK